MRLLSCPKQETLFEYVSIPDEVSVSRKLGLALHLKTCSDCKTQSAALRKRWEAYFTPEPEITSSLMKVYSRLQNDETLVLKGWKIGEGRPRQGSAESLFSRGWLWRGGMTMATLSLLLFLAVSRLTPPPEQVWASAKPPLAQIRFEDKKRVKVHYVEPELLQSIEFETTSAR